jgi:hypothetical protein
MLYQFENKRGAALILVFFILVGLSGIAFAFISMVSDEIGSAGAGLRNIQAFYIAEAGLAKARWALTLGEKEPPWPEGEPEEDGVEFGGGKYFIETEYSDPPANEHLTITSSGYIPDNTNPIAQRRVVEADILIGSGGLTNLSLSATISASSEKRPAANANDGDADTSWKSNEKDDAWLKLDFGSSTAFNRAIYAGSNINSCTIWYSDSPDDGYSLAASATGSSATVNFDLVEGRYLRFDMDVDSNKTAEVNELETYNTNEDVSATLGQGEFSTSW